MDAEHFFETSGSLYQSIASDPRRQKYL